MRALFALLFLALAAPGLAEEPKVVLVGEIVEVHPVHEGIRYVRYRVEELIAGEVWDDQIEVAHPASVAVGKKGDRRILFLSWDGAGVAKNPHAGDLPTLACKDAHGTLPVESEDQLVDIRLTAKGFGDPLAPYSAEWIQGAPYIVIAEVLKVGPPPALWTGSVVVTVQHIRYKVIEVLKGDVQPGEIEVGHYVAGGLTANPDPEEPGLSKRLFKPGNRLILLMSQESIADCRRDPAAAGNRLILLMSQESIADCRRDPAAAGVPTFCSGNLNYGAVPATGRFLAEARKAAGSPKADESPR